MQSIQDLSLKIKSRLERALGEWGIPFFVLLIALSCFGLGRLSVLVADNHAIRVVEATATMPAMALGKQYVASREGSVYYFPWCSGAQGIAASEQVWFTSENLAQKAGYSPAKNCRGLSDNEQ